MTNDTEIPSSSSDDLEEWEKPRLRLFFSADIVGSTAFKQTPKKDETTPGAYPHWFHVVLGFYHQAEREFSTSWDSYKRSFNGNDNIEHWFGPPPEIWKTVGDEVLFTKDVEHPLQALIAIHAWTEALSGMQAHLRNKHQLDVKSCVWLADFPLRNQEVVLGQSNPRVDDDYSYINQLALKAFYEGRRGIGLQTPESNVGNALLRDFIGPSIDTGFRLGAFASPRKMVISVELAHLLAVEQGAAEAEPVRHAFGPVSLRKFAFRYAGNHALKGVMGGRPYPIFWLDLDPEDPVHRAEDEIVNAIKPTAHQVCQLTAALLTEYKAYLQAPHFDPDCKDLHSKHKKIPPEQLVEISARHLVFIQEKTKFLDEAQDIASAADNAEDLPVDNQSDTARNNTAAYFAEFIRTVRAQKTLPGADE
ncbi:hypothetical protein [Eoetvoesiella caeni]